MSFEEVYGFEKRLEEFKKEHPSYFKSRFRSRMYINIYKFLYNELKQMWQVIDDLKEDVRTRERRKDYYDY